MSEPIGPVEFIGTIPFMDGALKAHGESGFRLAIDIPESDLPAYMRLHLMRGKVIRFTAEATDEVATPRSRGKKAVEKKRKASPTNEGEEETW